jgi:NADH-quinone oxidoreductase subunit N
MDPATLSNLSSTGSFLPEITLTVAICAAFLIDLALPGRGRRFHGGVALIGLAGALGSTLWLMSGDEGSRLLFNGLVALDPFAIFFKLLFIAVTALTVLFISKSPEVADKGSAELHAILLSTCLGMFVMASSNDMLMLYLSLELVSLTSYILAGYRKADRASSEAALKYVIYGGVASGTMLYGLSILYGLTGTTSLPGMREALAQSEGTELATLVGVALSLAGFGYKVAAVPFHMWAPDVYEGAPLPVTAFLSVGPKAAGFAALTRFFYVAFVEPGSWGGAPGGLQVAGAIPWPVLVGIMAALTMTVGNFAAIGQRNIKRLLAYSSIAHAGYMLLAFVALSEAGLTGLLFYLVVYLSMNLGAWVTAMGVSAAIGSTDLKDWRGLGFRAPAAAIAMTIFLFSLTGLPPLAGFIGKFHIFYAVIAKGGFWLVTLGIIGVLNSVVSLYYYAYVVKTMFLDEPAEDASEPFRIPPLYAALQMVLVVPTVVLGIYWGPVYEFVKSSIRLLI